MEKMQNKTSPGPFTVGTMTEFALQTSLSKESKVQGLQSSLCAMPQKTIVILGVPHAQPRPRVGRVGTKTILRDAAKQEKFYVGLQIKEEWGWFPTEGPIGIDFVFIYPPPLSWSKKKKESAIADKHFKISMPDIDNLTKFYLDAMTGVVYQNDNSVVFCNAEKIYGAEPKTMIGITKLI